jgi:hypothetical protein
MLLWHYERFPLTPVFMIILLGALIMIYLGLDIGGGAVSTGMWWAVHLPFSIYLGWITVATIANITAVLWLANWDGFGIGPEIWTAIILAVAVWCGLLPGFTSSTRLSRKSAPVHCWLRYL